MAMRFFAKAATSLPRSKCSESGSIPRKLSSSVPYASSGSPLRAAILRRSAASVFGSSGLYAYSIAQ